VVDAVPVVKADEVPPARVRASLATYRWLFGEEGWAMARGHAPAIEGALAGIAPAWMEELSWWAADAGTGVDDLLVLNARTELLSIVRAGRRTGECTVVAEPGVLGQTWDWFGRQRGAMVVLRTGGLITLTEAGMLAKIGVNDHGLAVGLERSTSGTSALAALQDVHLSASACIALVDPSAAALVEITPAGRAVLPPGAHTNHCLDAALRGLQGPVDFLADSQHRLRRADALWRAGTPIEELLADTAGGHEAVDQPPDPALDPRDRTETVLAIVIDPARRRLSIAPGRPSRTGFTQVVDL